MDNYSYQTEGEPTAHELGIVKIISMANSTPGPSCRQEVCQAARRRYPPPDLSDTSWHKPKCTALIVLLGLFFVWIIVYVSLTFAKIV